MCRCFYLHVFALFEGKSSWTRRQGGIRQRAHPQWLWQRRQTPTQPIVLKDGYSSSWPPRPPSMDGARRTPPRFFKEATEGESSGDEFGILEDDRCIDTGISSVAISCTSWCSPAAHSRRCALRSAILTQDEWCAVGAVARCQQDSSQPSRPWSRDPEAWEAVSTWPAAIHGTKHVCVWDGRSPGYLPKASAPVSFKPDTRRW